MIQKDKPAKVRRELKATDYQLSSADTSDYGSSSNSDDSHDFGSYKGDAIRRSSTNMIVDSSGINQSQFTLLEEPTIKKAITITDVEQNFSLSNIKKSIGNTTKANLNGLLSKVNMIVDRHQDNSYSEYAAMWDHK